MSESPHALLQTSRRNWLKGVLAATQAGMVLRSSAAGEVASNLFPFQLGIQSYSLRAFSIVDALARTRQLGLRYWESYSAHVPIELAKVDECKQLAAEAGVSITGFGVIPFTADHEANRGYFEFAKALGVAYLSADPTPDAFDSLDKLVADYGVGIGIHNHGPGHHWEKIATIHDAIKEHNPKIGCCIDTGHFLRSKEDPVEAARVFAGRIFGVHLKDVKDATIFTVLGKGDLQTADLLAELARQEYGYCLALEYEENPEDPMAEIRDCLGALKAAMPKS